MTTVLSGIISRWVRSSHSVPFSSKNLLHIPGRGVPDHLREKSEPFKCLNPNLQLGEPPLRARHSTIAFTGLFQNLPRRKLAFHSRNDRKLRDFPNIKPEF